MIESIGEICKSCIGMYWLMNIGWTVKLQKCNFSHTISFCITWEAMTSTSTISILIQSKIETFDCTKYTTLLQYENEIKSQTLIRISCPPSYLNVR